MKRTILIFALNRSPWIGGLYYRANIVNMLLHGGVKERYNIVILVNHKHAGIFDVFGDEVIIERCVDGANITKALVSCFRCFRKYDIKYVFPVMPYKLFKLLDIIPVSWIADFQHCYYPKYFDSKEIKSRNKNFKNIANADNPLVLSSYDSYSDLRKFYNNDRKNVFIAHFTSFIDNEIKQISKLQNKILEKYNLSGTEYCMICNQFWAHKNHIVVFEAIKIIAESNPELELKFVFTGDLSDRRNPEYVEKLKMLAQEPQVSERIQILGFIDRMDQLALMKNSIFIIQPSLFEGWGTTVEDAKKLGKTVLLSDIPVHKEQMDTNCKLFEKNDAVSLMKLINETLEDNNMEVIVVDRTKEYSKILEEVFI